MQPSGRPGSLKTWAYALDRPEHRARLSLATRRNRMTTTAPLEDGDDRALVHAFLADRSEGAFRVLYRRHSPRLYAISLRLTGGDTPSAEEVLQDTWITAVEVIESFRWESSLATWLTGIALNHHRSRWRRAARNRSSTPDMEKIPDPTPPPIGEHGDIERAVSRLPEGYRTVLTLYGIYGYTHAEIGRMLDITEGTSKSQLSRARQALRAMLTGGTGDTRRPREESP